MIEQLTLKAGRSPESPAEPITLTPITVFVGPNNSGKSKVLQEIQYYCCNGVRVDNEVVLGNIHFISFSSEEIKTYASSYKRLFGSGQFYVSRDGSGSVISESDLSNALQFSNTHPHKRSFCHNFLKFHTMRLDGLSRMNIIDHKPIGDLQEPPTNNFQILFIDDNKRYEVRRIISEAFGRHFVLDATYVGQLRIRLSDEAPENPILERGLHAEAVAFQRKAQLIGESSDGVKAFTGIITEVIAGDPKILLIDEPEAFYIRHSPISLGKKYR